MGRAVMGLIGNELRHVIADPSGDEGRVLAGLAEERLASREEQIAARERSVGEAEERLSEWAQRLRTREAELRTSERQVRAVRAQAQRQPGSSSRVGRNERCPCKSGLKHKHCHGLAGRSGASPPT